MLDIMVVDILLIADYHNDSIFVPDCATVAELHSWVVNFHKNGKPFPSDFIPRPKIRLKPDWFALDVTNTSNADYYGPDRALGELPGGILGSFP